MPRTLTASDRSRLIRLASTLPVGHPERKAILAGLNKQGATLREVKTVLHRAGLLNHCELSGSGKDWEIECPDEGVMKRVSKALQKARIPWGGYRTGYGAWVMREKYQGKGDWNDPYSKHHYASDLYKSLNDAALVTGDARYDKGSTKVWYTKPDFTRDMRMGYDWLVERQGQERSGWIIQIPTARSLTDTHVLLGTVQERNPEAVYSMMQGMNWSPQGEARNLIRSKGLGHTSMSVGDILQVGSNLFMVDRFGFEKISKIARGYPPAIESLMADMQRLQGVEDVYVTDTWKDGYHHLRVVLKPQPGKTPWGGMSNTGTFDIRTTARGGYDTVYNFPLYPKIIRAVRALVKRSGLALEGIEGLQKVYEYQDAYDRASGEPKKGGYSDNEISVEVYV